MLTLTEAPKQASNDLRSEMIEWNELGSIGIAGTQLHGGICRMTYRDPRNHPSPEEPFVDAFRTELQVGAVASELQRTSSSPSSFALLQLPSEPSSKRFAFVAWPCVEPEPFFCGRLVEFEQARVQASGRQSPHHQIKPPHQQYLGLSRHCRRHWRITPDLPDPRTPRRHHSSHHQVSWGSWPHFWQLAHNKSSRSSTDRLKDQSGGSGGQREYLK